jgi:large subunit ribosomal protein L24e
MAKCSFCKTAIEPGTGTMYVKKDSTILHFCTMKCEKNMLNLGRVPRFIKWTKSFEKGGVKK